MNLTLTKSLLRSLFKRRFMTFIQIFGLVIGFGIVIFLVTKISFEHSYDTFWNDYQNVYRVALDLKYPDGRSVESAKNFHGSTEMLEAELPCVAAHCNMAPDKITVYYHEKMIQDVNWFWSDTSFFNVFERKLIFKATDQIFSDVHSIAISESFARKLFGDENPLNKQIRLNEGWLFFVKAVFEDIPANSHLKLDVLGSYKSLSYYSRNFDPKEQVLIERDFVYRRASPYTQSRWRSAIQTRPYCYLRLADNARIEEVEAAVEPALKKVALPENLADCKMKFVFQPLSSIHLQSNLDGELNANGSSLQVNFLVVICLIVIVVCFVNFLNLGSICAIRERKNYSIRMINGSDRSGIFWSLFFRNFLLFLISFLIALPLALVAISQLMPWASLPMIAITGCGASILVGAFFASLIPFISVLNKPAYQTLKGQVNDLHSRWFGRKALVVLQFAITIILLTSTIAIYRQMQFVMKEQLGFKGEQTLFCYTPMSITNHPDIPTKLLAFRDESMSILGFKSFSVSSSVPGKAIRRWNENVNPAGSAEPYASPFGEISVDDKFVEAYGLKVIAGKDLMQQSTWISDEVLINRSAAEAMGFKNPADAIGTVFSSQRNNYKVRGVIEDYHHVSLHFPIKPIIFYQNLTWDLSVGYYSFQVESRNTAAVAQQLSLIWKRLYPKNDFIYFFSDKEFEAQYKNDQAFNQILSFSGVMALVISSLGLLSLAMFNTGQRIKEIGIRKVNGAKVSEILILLNREFVVWVLIAFIIALPVAWYAMNQWLEGFAYKINLSWWIFIATGVFTLITALLTVSFQSYKAATRNPVEALRYE